MRILYEPPLGMPQHVSDSDPFLLANHTNLSLVEPVTVSNAFFFISAVQGIRL